jgi:glutathionyl-hydroquinone reductase
MEGGREMTGKWDHSTKPSKFVVIDNNNEIYRGGFAEGYKIIEAERNNLLQEWKDMAAKLVNIASYALGEFDVQLTLDQQRTITETMRQYHSLLKKK